MSRSYAREEANAAIGLARGCLWIILIPCLLLMLYSFYLVGSVYAYQEGWIDSAPGIDTEQFQRSK